MRYHNVIGISMGAVLAAGAVWFTRPLTRHWETAPPSMPLPVFPNSVSQPGAVAREQGAGPASGRVTADAFLSNAPTPSLASPMGEGVFHRFANWAARYRQATGDARRELLGEGVRLARARQAEMLKLMRADPARALQVAAPVSWYQDLPPAVGAWLEQPVVGVGEWLVAVRCPLPGRESDGVAIYRTWLQNGREYEVVTYGRRLQLPCRRNLPVVGVALGRLLAVADAPARVVASEEMHARTGGSPGVARCVVCAEPAGVRGEATGLEVGGQVFHCCGANHAAVAVARLQRIEASLPPGVSFPDHYAEMMESEEPPIMESAYTEGTKRLLIMRVDFPDYTGERVSYATLSNLVNSMNTFWRDMSYDKTGWAPVEDGSEVTPTMRLAKDSSNYESLASLRGAARSAASSAGYDLSDYEFDMVVTAAKPDAGFAGVGYVGGPGCWIANGYWQVGVCSHELGHNFGLGHANFWNASETGSAIGAGTSEGYGDIFDTMGMAYSGTKQHFHAKFKNYLNWITSSGIKTVTANGTNRLYRHDHPDATTGYRGLKIARTSSQSFWVDFRQLWTANKWAMSGVILHWGGSGGGTTDLIDTTPDTSDGKDDSPIVLGRTFSDLEYGIHITPVAKGTAFPEYMDVVVNLGAFSANQPPQITVAASATNVSVNTTVNFTATASDPNGDTLAYYWDFGDKTFGANSATASHKWSSAGESVVRCTASDMKGGLASDSFIVRVGSPSTYRISGTVYFNGEGLEGVRVAVSSSQYVYTDSDGAYTLTGLATGSFTVSAAKEGHSFARSGFSNPVSVGPNKTNINFVGGLPGIGNIADHAVNMNQNTGPIPVTVGDQETAAGSLVLAGTASNTNLVPDARITFGGSGSNRTVTVAPATGQAGTATLTITVTDADDNSDSDSFTLTVNAPPTAITNRVSTVMGNAVEVDLWPLAGDTLTADSNLLFTVTNPVYGTVTLLTNGHTVRFLPATGYLGTGSFGYTVTDKGYHPSLLLYYDFEPSDTPADSKASDRSGQAREGAFEDAGSGAFTYVTNAGPPALAPYDLVSLRLDENGDGNAARLYRSVPASEFDFRNADWTFTAWFRRDSTNGDDFIFHVGDGDGFGSNDELQVFCPAGLNVVRLGHYGSAGNDLLLSSPATVGLGQWHQVAVVYDRTNANQGNFEFYLDGLLVGTNVGVPLAMDQAAPVSFGGHSRNDVSTSRWFDGRLDEIALWKTRLTAAQIAYLTNHTVAHFGGLTTNTTVTVNVVINPDAPLISDVRDQTTLEDTPAGPMTFRVGDPQTPAANLLLTASSSNPTLLPVSNIVFGGADSNRWVILYPATNLNGSAMVTLTVSDGTNITSDVFTLTVTPVNDPPSPVALLTPTEGSVFHAPATFELNALVGDPDGNLARVDFYLGATRLGSVSNAPYSLGWSNVALGGYRLKVVAVDADGLSATSAVINVSVVPAPLVLVARGAAWHYDDTGTNYGTAWRELDFDDRAWAEGPAQLGFGDGDEATVINTNRTLITTYFRRRFEVDNPLASQVLTLDLLRDDGAVIYLNGAEVWRSNMPTNSAITADTWASVAVGGGDETTNYYRAWISPDGLRAGTNGLAVEVHQRGTNSTDLSFDLGLLATNYPDLTLVPTGAVWKYLDTGADPGATWTATNFNDAGWASGPAQLGYGDGDESTLVTSNRARITTWFRHAFTVSNPRMFTTLTLRLLRDDGAVVYLNGMEVFRSNLPTNSPIRSNTWAIARAEGADETNHFYGTGISPWLLCAGTNVLAVEVHQNGTNSSDLSFDLELAGVYIPATLLVAAGSDWKFDDTGADLGTAWREPGLDDTAWPEGPAQLGFGDRDEATLVVSNSTRITTYFRRRFMVHDPTLFGSLTLRLVRDDGAVVYLNGQEVHRSNMSNGPVAWAAWASNVVSGANESAFYTATLPPNALVAGLNTLAVEVHQANTNSSDLSFDLELSGNIPVRPPPFALMKTGRQVHLLWPIEALGLCPEAAASLRNPRQWLPLTNGIINENGWLRLTEDTTNTARFYRLVVP